MTYWRSQHDLKRHRNMQSILVCKYFQLPKFQQLWLKYIKTNHFNSIIWTHFWMQCGILLEQRYVCPSHKTKFRISSDLLVRVVWAQKLMRAFFSPPRLSTLLSPAWRLSYWFILLTLTTSSSVEEHLTASEMSVTEASMPTVTTFTGTATVFPVRTAVFNISES